MNAIERTKRLSMLMSDQERAMLEALAIRDGITASDWIRLTVRRAHAEAFGDKPPKPAKRPPKVR